MQETLEIPVGSLGPEDALEEGMATGPTPVFLESSMDRGAWQAIVHRVTESDMIEAT